MDRSLHRVNLRRDFAGLMLEKIDGVAGMMPQQMIRPASRFAFRVHIGSPEEECLYNEVLDFEFAFLDLLMDPLMARIEPARMPGHSNHACLFLCGGNS